MSSLEQEVRSLLDQRKKIEAVKLYKSRTGAHLKDAKDAVEALAAGRKLPQPSAPPSGDSAPPTGHSVAPTGDEALAMEILPVLRMGEVQEAVRLYQRRTGVGRQAARQAIEALARRHGVAVSQSQGLPTMLLLLVFFVALMVLAFLAGLMLGG